MWLGYTAYSRDYGSLGGTYYRRPWWSHSTSKLYLDMDKRSLRKQFIKSRKSVMAEYSAHAAEKAAEIFCKSFALKKDMVIGVYQPIHNELDTFPLIKTLDRIGCKTALPCVEEEHSPLVFRLWSADHELEEGAFRIREPLKNAQIVVPDIIVAPLVAFDKSGSRLGYGAGCYDRTFAVLSAAKKVGYAFLSQYTDELPSDGHDQKLDYVVTEEKMFNFN